MTNKIISQDEIEIDVTIPEKIIPARTFKRRYKVSALKAQKKDIDEALAKAEDLGITLSDNII